MVSIELTSASFHSPEGWHTFRFTLRHAAEKTPIGALDVVTHNVGGDANAVFVRAHENLVSVLEKALEAARALPPHGGAAPLGGGSQPG